MKINPITECKNTELSCNVKERDAEIDLNFFFRGSSLRVEGWEDMGNDGCVTLYVRSTEEGVSCPYCGQYSEKVHSRYHRHLRDLPALGKEVSICFEARKFFCNNHQCRYRTFAEQPGNEMFRYRRRTRRCEVVVYRHGLCLSSMTISSLLTNMGSPYPSPLCYVILTDLMFLNAGTYVRSGWMTGHSARVSTTGQSSLTCREVSRLICWVHAMRKTFPNGLILTKKYALSAGTGRLNIPMRLLPPDLILLKWPIDSIS